jgi:hypothetical protein
MLIFAPLNKGAVIKKGLNSLLDFLELDFYQLLFYMTICLPSQAECPATDYLKLYIDGQTGDIQEQAGAELCQAQNQLG